MDAKTAVDTKGIGFAADSGSPVTKKLGDSLNIKGDNKNITTKINDGNVHVTLNDDISVQNVNAAASVITPKVVAGDSTLTSDGLNITGGPSITKTGISAGNKPITNVASGGTTDSNAANIGDVKKAAAAAKTVVKQGANTTVSSATDAATGATEYTINAEKSVVQGSSDVSVNAVTNGLTTTYTADLSTTAKASLAKADTAVQKVVSSNSNLTASKTGDTVTLDFSQTPSFSSVTTGNSVLTSDGLKIGGGANSVSLTGAGLSNGGNKITNIADGAADTDAASYKQVKAAKTEVQGGTNVASVTKTDGTNGQAIYTVNAKGAAVSAEGTDNGLKLTSSEDTTTNVTTYNLDLSDKTKASLTKADSALQNIGVQVNGTDAKTLTKDDSTLKFINGTGTTAENKADGIAFNVNKSTLKASTGGLVSADKAGDAFATAADVAQAINQAVTNSEKTSVVAAGDNTHVASDVSGNQTTYTVHADKTTVSAKTGGKLTVTSAQTANANQTKTTNYELDLTDAAKAEIAKGVEAKTAVDTKGIGFAADSGSPVTKKLGDSLNIKGDNKNIETEAGTDGIKVKLKDEITLTSVTANTLKAGDSVLTNDGLNIAKGTAGSPVSLTKSGLNNGGNKITKVAKGENEDDAVNYTQLKELADKGLTFDADGNTSTSSKKLGERVGIKGGNNITTSADNDNVTVKLNDDITLTSVTATTLKAGDSTLTTAGLVTPKVTAGNSVLENNGLTISNGTAGSSVSLTKNGLNNGGNKIANVAKGTAATDAVNVAQLNEQLAATEKTTTVVAGKNVTVSEKVDGNNTEYTVNADKTTLSQAAGGAVKVSEGAKDADGVTDYALDLTDEAKADIAKGVAAKDAVDNKGLTFAADNGTTGAKKLGDSLSVKGDGNILTRADENGIGFSLADKITVGKAGKGNKPLVIDGTAGLISGLSNTTLGGADFATKGQAASEEQLNAAQANLANLLGGNAANDKGNVTTTDIGGTGKDNVHDAIAAVKETADKGWNLNANDETSSEKIGAGDTVTFKEGKNVKVSRNGKNITVATSDDVSFDKVTVGGSVLTDNGLTVGNGKAGKPVSLTKDGLDNGGNKVTNVAKGTADTDAVNVAQLKAAAAKATSKVDSGNDNIVVTPEQNADGSTTYKVATAPDLKADSLTAGDTVVNNDGVKVGDKVALGKDGLKAGDVNITADGINAGNKAISNVAEGKKDTDAVNVGQLNRLTAAAKTEVEAGTNIASVSSKQGANGQTVYTVNADGASVSAGSDNIVVTKGNKDANNVTDYAVDLSKAVKADIAKGVAAKDAVDNKGISFAGDSGTTVANKLGDTVAVKGDVNITTTAGANGIQVGLNKDLKVDSVKAGDTVVNNSGVNVGDKVVLGKDGLKAGDVNITAEGINAGGKKVTNVAAGTVAADSTDAVNGGQLHQMYELIGSNGGNVNTAPPAVEADGKAGLGNIKNITLVDNSNNPNVTNVTNETKIAQSNGYSLVTYNVEDQGMYVTNNVIEAVGRMNEQGIKFFHTNDGEVEPDVQAYNGEDSSASGAYATAVGYQAASKGTNAIAIGKGAKANAENTIAIGTGNIVSGKNSGAIGDPTVVSGNSSYSIGNNNNVSADNAYALGSDIKATVKDSVYLGDRAQTQGIRTADAAKGEAYTYGGLNDKAVAGKAGSTAAANKVAGVVTVGNGTDETRQVQGVAAGVVSADSTDAINGSQLYYTNQAIANVATQATAAKTEVTAGKNVIVNQTTGNSGQTVYNVATADKLDVTSVTAGGVTVNAQGVSIAAPTAHNPANTVSLSPIGLNNGGQRITNVAPAKEGTDAVNLNQLAGMGNALQNNIERVGKKAYAGVAGAIAHSSIPQVTRPGATGLSVGSGYYGGQSAVAVGLSTMSDNGNWVFKGSFSANTDGHLGVGAGALYQW